MIRQIEGSLAGAGLRIGIAVASWNRTITDRLLQGALDRAEALGVEVVTVLRVPGALELGVAAKRLIDTGHDAVVAIGTVVKGGTDHYDIVVRESASALSVLGVTTGVPVANAILAVHDIKDALDRSGEGPANKGYEAIDAAVSTANALAALTQG